MEADKQAADPRAQAMFDKTLELGMKGLTSDQVSQRVLKDAESRGPAMAIAEAVSQVMEGVAGAAQQGGVEIPREVAEAAAVAMSRILAQMMNKAGGTDDPEALTKQIVQILRDGGVKP